MSKKLLFLVIFGQNFEQSTNPTSIDEATIVYYSLYFLYYDALTDGTKILLQDFFDPKKVQKPLFLTNFGQNSIHLLSLP